MTWGLVTPREVLRQIKADPRRPWWADRLFREVEEHLTRALFRGKPVIDQRMTSAACEAVLEEAVDAVRRPKTVDELMAEMRTSVLQ